MNIPPEYHGPHAKRWTDPDTGTTYSLRPSDYVAVVGAHQARLDRRREAQDTLALLDDILATRAQEQAERIVIHQWGTEAEYLGNTRGPQPTTAYIDEHTTIDINVENTSEEARMKALQDIDRELIRRGWKNSPEADASVEESSVVGAGYQWLDPVSARSVTAARTEGEKAARRVLSRRRWVPKFVAGACLVYILLIIGVTLVAVGGQ